VGVGGGGGGSEIAIFGVGVRGVGVVVRRKAASQTGQSRCEVGQREDTAQANITKECICSRKRIHICAGFAFHINGTSSIPSPNRPSCDSSLSAALFLLRQSV
jgi:hypothetical protein